MDLDLPDVATARISIVVPSFNQAQFIGATLDSLLTQKDPNLEIIVVDGGSTDGSVDVIRRYADRIASWVSEPDSGQSEALNKGFAKATGQWLGWLNSDDLLLPGTLASLRRNIQSQPERKWWIGGGYFIDDHGKRFRDFGPPLGLERIDQLSDWREFWFAQPSTFFTRELFDNAGRLIREDLHYAMDLDLWLRLLPRAMPGFVQEEWSVYRLHALGKTLALSVNGEAEIVSVLTSHLGLDKALDRVRKLAEERDALKSGAQSVRRKLRPLFELNDLLHRARKAIGGRK